MPNELQDFITKARAKGLSDETIQQRLMAAGWSPNEVEAALPDDLVVPRPPAAARANQPDSHDANNPLPVVQNLSTKGFEYSIMFLALWASALSIAGLLHTQVSNLMNKSYASGGTLDTFWVTVLVVFAPILAFMFIRLKRFELQDPSLLKDPSRRKLSHLTQLITFLIGVIYLIYFIYSLVSGNIGKESQMSFGELITHVLITLSITAPIFAYYWREEHKLTNK